MRIRMPTKLGFKNPKHVIGLAVLNNYTGGYWEDRGYNWFSGLCIGRTLSVTLRRSPARASLEGATARARARSSFEARFARASG